MATKNITILKNFAHVKGSFIRGEHYEIDAVLGNQFIEANLASECEHGHEGETETPQLLEVPNDVVDEVDIVMEKPKKSRKKKVNVDE